jgi:hypothetical protein
VSDRDDDRDDRPTPPARSRDEPEPDWAEEIRRLRRARGDRLRKVFSGFDDEQEER